MTTGLSYTLVGSLITLTVTLSETNSALNYVSAVISWGDGTTAVIPRLNKASATGLVYTHAFPGPGFYTVSCTGSNYRTPTPDTDTALVSVSIPASNVNPQPTGLIRGPVLPENDNDGNWVFNTGTDIQLIASDVRNLLLTRQGERIMYPDFGTALATLIFEPDDAILEAQVQQQVSQAITKFEPRCSIISISTTRHPESRSMSVDVQLRALDQFLTVGVVYR